LRTVFVLRDIEGLTIDQTAEVLTVSQTAVKARLWRARLQLREGLTEYFSKQEKSARAESSLYRRLIQGTPHSHSQVADQLNAT
jgi:predicted RNA polymerase sigma factor